MAMTMTDTEIIREIVAQLIFLNSLKSSQRAIPECHVHGDYFEDFCVSCRMGSTLYYEIGCKMNYASNRIRDLEITLEVKQTLNNYMPDAVNNIVNMFL